MSLIIISCCLAMSLVGLGGYTFREVRQVEILLLDHQVIFGGSFDFNTRLQELLDARQNWINQAPSSDRARALNDITGELQDLGGATHR